jgi:peptidyl-prolyl cis-trans isomerase C
MTRHLLNAAICLGTVFLGGCNAMNNHQPDHSSMANFIPRPEVKPENLLATVNGKPIARSAISQQHRQGPASEEKIKDELVQRELLRQEAERLNLLADPGVAEKLDNALRMAISQVAAEHYVKAAMVTDEEIRKEYEQQVAAKKKSEYKARHILVDSEAKAKEVIAKLSKGAKFEDLAKKLSTDQGSKVQGGDLGWFALEQMVEPFANAVAGLQNGETTQTPVQSQFGWHVIQREDAREQQPPAFDEVKNQVRMMLQTRKFQQHIEDLKKSARVEIAAASVKTETKPAPSQAEPSPAP